MNIPLAMRGAVAAGVLLFGTAACKPFKVWRVEPAGHSGPREIVVQGPYTHTPTGAVFPEVLAGCRRGTITAYAPGEADIGATYQDLRGSTLFATVYIYPRAQRPPLEPEPHLRGVVEEVKAHHPGAVAGEIREVAVGERRGLAVAFDYETRFGFRNTKVASQAWLFACGDWFVKFRMTWPKDQDARAQDLLEPLVRQFGWPAVGTAGEPR
ncbi:MAG: hypothetical protein JNK15_17725 [Planctomycetes bacterium]|nr:hypothetical protein [Planctomycetota bacterium]